MPESLWIVLLAIIGGVIGVVLAKLYMRKAEQPRPANQPPATDEQVQDEIADWAGRYVRMGFDTRDQIVEMVTEAMQDDYPDRVTEQRVAEITDRLLTEHYEAQQAWGRPTDCDKLDQAFAALQQQGIVARQNFTCCQNCGLAEMGDEIAEFAKHTDPIGYTFYHQQDTESAELDGSFCLAYGTVGGDENDALAIGGKVRQTLEAHGLTVEWNGQLDRRIEVTGLDWKKWRDPQ